MLIIKITLKDNERGSTNVMVDFEAEGRVFSSEVGFAVEYLASGEHAAALFNWLAQKAVLLTPASDPSQERDMDTLADAIKDTLGLKGRMVEIRSPEDLERAIRGISEEMDMIDDDDDDDGDDGEFLYRR